MSRVASRRVRKPAQSLREYWREHGSACLNFSEKLHPLSDLVARTLNAAATSIHTRKVYQTAIGLFLQYLDTQRGDSIPAALAGTWRPFAHVVEKTTQHRRAGDKKVVTTKIPAWEYRAPAAVLRLIDSGILDGFRRWREAQGDKLNAVTLRVAAVRTFLAVALRDQVLTLEQGQVLGLKPYRQKQKRDQRPVGRRLNRDEARALRAAIDITTLKGMRDLAIIDAMLCMGLRREEVAMLRGRHLTYDRGRWWVEFVGKGQKTRRIKIHDFFYTSLWRWLDAIGLDVQRAVAHQALFLTVNKGDRLNAEEASSTGLRGRPIDGSVISRVVLEYGRSAGLVKAGKELTPHDLRRTAGRNAHDNGASLLLVQLMLGHSDPKTTAHYIGLSEQDETSAVDFVRY